MKMSIVIPALNEEEYVNKLIQHLIEHGDERLQEVILIDGGSADQTLTFAKEAGAKALLSPERGRAKQMNYGVKNVSPQSDVYYFVHADSLPPASYLDDIEASLLEGYPIGCFRFKFNSPKTILKINSYFTRFDKIMFRGGDQSLFITRKLHHQLGGFCERHVVMEDYDIITRARKTKPFKIIPKDVLVSARKYDENSWLRVNVSNLIIFKMYEWGYPTQKLWETYKKLLKHPKSEA
jgi:rSAM/selenodomain-associated transferase 2